MSARIRGQEATVQIIVDGDLQTGTFTKVMSFNLTPRQEVVETDFLGELESDLDFIHHGYDFDFEIQHQDSKAWDLLQTLVSREQEHLPHPNINIVVFLAFRTLGEPSLTLVLEECFAKMDSLGFGGRKEYVSSKFSGKCKRVNEIT